MLRVIILTGIILLIGSAAFASDECMKCHGNENSKTKAPIINPETIKSSIHFDLECSDCHTIDPRKNHAGIDGVLCGRCHEDEAKSYAASPHVKGRSTSVEDIPVCYDCHGTHEILKIDDDNSPTNHINSVKVCTRCHEDEAIPEQHEPMPDPMMIIAYENSVHGQALLQKDNMEAPACVDCHGSHSFLPSDKLDSPLNKINIAKTCGQCHEEISSVYESSIHGQALVQGVTESPTCTDCHGEHNIQAHLDPDSKVFTTNIPMTCSACHTSEKVVAKYGLKPDRIETFKESFHGIAGELGDTRTANCASCHGVHNIFEKTDSRSTIHKDNIQQTCGQCHDDLPADFAQAEVHTTAESKDSGGKYYVRQFYWYFITIIIVGFILYRILEYKRRQNRRD